MNIEYRKLAPKESRKYREIRLECLKNHPESFGSTYEDEVKKSKLFFEACIIDKNEFNSMYGAFDGENLIGICGFAREERGSRQHCGTIVHVYLKPEYRGKNISLELSRFTIENIFMNNEIEYITLGVVSGNNFAHKLYEKLGFVQYGLQKNYLKWNGKNYDQIFMRLENYLRFKK